MENLPKTERTPVLCTLDYGIPDYTSTMESHSGLYFLPCPSGRRHVRVRHLRCYKRHLPAGSRAGVLLKTTTDEVNTCKNIQVTSTNHTKSTLFQ